MRRFVPGILFLMLAAFGTSLYLNYDGDAATPSGPSTPAEKAALKATETDKAKPATPAPPPALRRTLRTVALGWEFLTPGVIANGGSTPGAVSSYKMAGVDASFLNAPSMEDIESALAKGGAVPGGADIAIMPLSSYVASYEKLRALSPEVIFVVGWSRGREALYGTDARTLTKLATSGTIKVAGASGQPETFLALFVLDLAGVPASRVEIAPKGAKTPLATAFRTTKEKPPGKLLVTSADLPHLMPIVAVAPHGFIKAHGSELETWGRIWLTGVSRLQTDVPDGGRQVASIAGAPPVLQIIEALGQIEFASLRENAAAAGLSGRGALTLDEIFRITWRIWRDTGVITTPPPEVSPLHTGLIASLVRTEPNASAVDAPRPRVPSDAKRPEVLLVVKAPAGKLDAEAFVTRIGFLAGVFDRLPLRISVKDDAKTATLLMEMARDRFGLRPAQLSVANRAPSGSSAAIEVLSTN
jgi:hypothetical protein